MEPVMRESIEAAAQYVRGHYRNLKVAESWPTIMTWQCWHLARRVRRTDRQLGLLLSPVLSEH